MIYGNAQALLKTKKWRVLPSTIMFFNIMVPTERESRGEKPAKIK